MKLVSLNTWGGTHFKPLMAFIAEHAPTTDVFCFQEVTNSSSRLVERDGARVNLMGDFRAALSDFESIFLPVQDTYGFADAPIDFEAQFGLALFVRKSIAIHSGGHTFITRTYNEIINKVEHGVSWPSALQYTRITIEGHDITIINIHGEANPGTKLDTPERLAQSKNILDFLAGQPGEKILCGDFNLMPETESIAMIERAGMRNLIKEFGITDTRGVINHAKHPDDIQYFADYTFVTPGISVTSFTVPHVPISDHLPMVLEFEV